MALRAYVSALVVSLVVEDDTDVDSDDNHLADGFPQDRVSGRLKQSRVLQWEKEEKENW